MPLPRLLLALVLLVGFRTSVFAQDTTRTANLRATPGNRVARLELRDGSTLFGQVLEVTATTVSFTSSVGIVTLQRANIVSVKLVDPESIHAGEVWPEDPSRTRLFFAPTGRMMRSGEAYFSDAYIFFASGQYGLTDRVTVGAAPRSFLGSASTSSSSS